MSCVDVVVPCYGYGHFLQECVESVLAQSGPDVRVLIIDDASPDNTAEVAATLSAKDRRVNWVRHARNKGHIATYNEGIEWVSSQYMLLLSPDDYLLPGALALSVCLLDNHADVGFTFGRAIEVNDCTVRRPAHCATQKPHSRILDGLAFIKLSAARNIVPTATAVVRVALQKRVGGYRLYLPHTGDMEMWLRLAAHAPVGVVEAYQAVLRRHAQNMSRAYFLAEGGLPDLSQRKAALDSFFETCPTLLQVHNVRQSAYASLAADAISRASVAVNDGNMPLAGRLSDFAVAVYPGTRKSWPWAKLTCKRRMPSLWRVLQPLVTAMRRRMARFRRS